jgi:hypothetical protein
MAASDGRSTGSKGSDSKGKDSSDGFVYVSSIRGMSLFSARWEALRMNLPPFVVGETYATIAKSLYYDPAASYLASATSVQGTGKQW